LDRRTAAGEKGGERTGEVTLHPIWVLWWRRPKWWSMIDAKTPGENPALV